jgi:hypothetical protein
VSESSSPNYRANTDWFRDAKWGIFFHYLSEEFMRDVPAEQAVETWNSLVDGFDVEGLAKQLAEVKAGYFFITLGQNAGFYLSPNATYDKLVGHNPSHLSRRDLVADLIKALTPYNIPMMVYFTACAPCLDRRAVEALKCTPPWDRNRIKAQGYNPDAFTVQPGVDNRLTEFQHNWEAIISEWSRRWGQGVKGWWFDGVYSGDLMYDFPDPPNYASFVGAAKAGNPDSLVALNSGVFPHVGMKHIGPQSAYDDFTAGEVRELLPSYAGYEWLAKFGGLVDGARYHILTFMGTTWCSATPRFPDALVVGYTQLINQHEGVITWDMRPTKEGLISDAFMKQLCVLRNATR